MYMHFQAPLGNKISCLQKSSLVVLYVADKKLNSGAFILVMVDRKNRSRCLHCQMTIHDSYYKLSQILLALQILQHQSNKSNRLS